MALPVRNKIDPKKPTIVPKIVDFNPFFRHAEWLLKMTDSSIGVPERIKISDQILMQVPTVFGTTIELRSDLAAYEEHVQYAQSLLRNTIKASNVERSVRDAIERAMNNLYKIHVRLIELKNKPPKTDDY
jgi:hypothetical protein